jgi:hypothetical protein
MIKKDTHRQSANEELNLFAGEMDGKKPELRDIFKTMLKIAKLLKNYGYKIKEYEDAIVCFSNSKNIEITIIFNSEYDHNKKNNIGNFYSEKPILIYSSKKMQELDEKNIQQMINNNFPDLVDFYL